MIPQMTVQEKIEVLQAIEDHKTIQIQHRGAGAWHDCANNGWSNLDFSTNLYRIKPETE